MIPESNKLLLLINDCGCTQVTIDTLKHGLSKAQQMREKDAEKHRREEARLQERHEALVRFTKVKLASPFDPLL